MDTFDQTQYCIKKIREKNIHKFEEESTNGSLNAVPSTLKFTFDSGNFKIQEKKIEIMNYFLKPCPIRFLSLETDYFRFKNVYQVNKKNYTCIILCLILYVSYKTENCVYYIENMAESWFCFQIENFIYT